MARPSAVGKTAVGVEALAAPLHAARGFDFLPGEVAVVAHAAGGDALPLAEGVVRGRPAGIEYLADAHALGEIEEDVEVGARLAGRSDDAIRFADAALGVGVGAFLFAPDGGGQDEVGEVAGGRGVEAVLHDEELDTAQCLFED